MLKRSLYITTPHHLSVKNNQLVLESKEDSKTKHTVPIEDLGFIILEHSQISITIPSISILSKAKVCIIFCDQKKMPVSTLIPFEGNNIQNEIYRLQITSSTPINKNLWKQIIKQKITNQAKVLQAIDRPFKDLLLIAESVLSDDSRNCEAHAARLYWPRLMENSFIRNQEAEDENILFNYGYTVLRAAVSRALVGSGLLPTWGIHHHNRYNAFCLADDIMEPYRPFVDKLVFDIIHSSKENSFLTKENKAQFIRFLADDIPIDKTTRPCMIALKQTSASLVRCYLKESKILSLPKFK